MGSNPSVGIGNPGNTDICAPNTLTFPITGAAGNTPGTTYIVTFNDGSAPVSFNQPPPATVSHTFTVTSCGVTSSNGTTTFPNSFSASITASNPCGTSAGAIVPIYVSTVPAASLTVSPNPICVNSSSCMTNTSTGAGDIANGVCTTTSPCIWYITPAVGWTLTSGSLGNSFGQNGDPSLWLAGSTTICATFTQVGTYTIKIITGGHCGLDSTTSTLCVVPPPVPNFTINPNAGCAPITIATTNTTTAAACDILSYWWDVSPSFGWTFASGTNTSTAPSFNFTVAGTYTISMSVTSVCGTYTITHTVVIQSPPIVSVNPLSGACGSVTVNPTGNFNPGGGTISSYSWTFPGGNPANSNQQVPPAVTYNSPGTYTITATASNQCGPASGSTTLIVYPIPIANAGANQTICAGTTTTLNGSATTGTPNYNYSWSPTATLSSPFSSSTSATPAATTTYTLLVTDANGCTDNDQMVVNLIAAPNVTVNAVPAAICEGQSSVLTANGATTYTWSPNTALSATTGSSVTATPTITTTYTVTGTTGTCSDIETVIVTVNPIPVLNINPNPVTICVGSSAVLTANGASSYTWSPSTGLTATTGTTVTASPTVTTTYTVLGTSASSCTATSTVVVTVTALPVVTASSTDYTICNGQSTTLNGVGATTYSWLPVTGLSNPNSSTTTASPTVTTTYTLTGIIGANCQATDTVVVNVLPLPTINVNANPAQICAGGSTTLTANGGFGYQWSPSTGLSQTNGNNITANPTVTTTYTVTGNGANGCSNSNTVVITVNPLPIVSVNPPAPFICLGNSQVLTASGASAYTWTPSANLSASTGTTVTATPVSVGTFTYTVVGTTAAGCTASTTVALGVNGLPNVVASTLNYTICFGSSTTLNAAGAVNYTWVPNTGLSSSTGNTVTANPTTTTTYTVTGTSGLNCNDDDTIVVNVLPLPVINSNPANPSICIGESVSITLSGAVNYVWTPNTALSGTTGATVTASPTATTTYTVTVTGANGCTTQSQVIVVVHPLPNLNVNPNPVVLCLNSSQNLTATGGSTYVWSPNIGLSSTTGNIVSINPTANITYSVTATTIFGCMDSTTVPVTVNTNTVATSTDYQLCLGESTTMTANNGSTYQWNPNTGLSTSTNSTVTASPTVTTTYTATAFTTGGCSTTDTVVIIVNPIPNVGLVPASVIQCAGTSILMNSSGANAYTWSPSILLSASTGSSVTASPFTNTTYTVIGTDLNG
ncbi:MAG: PKD domain-containing protein, partial [Bacteroidota bacterium]